MVEGKSVAATFSFLTLTEVSALVLDSPRFLWVALVLLGTNQSPKSDKDTKRIIHSLLPKTSSSLSHSGAFDSSSISSHPLELLFE